MQIGELYEKAWKTIISPYHVRHKLTSLGPSEQMSEGKRVIRVDIDFLGVNGQRLSGFLSYCPDIAEHDLVVYLHGNGGCKTDAIDLLKTVGKYELAIASFDFAGCGNSQDRYLTYGLNECDDLGLFLNVLYSTIKPRSLTLWGRSMGAVTAIMFAQRYSERVDGLVLDGPFRRLSTVVEMASYQASPLPRPIIQAFLYFVKRKVDSELNLESSVFSIDYLQVFRRIPPRLSVLFIFSNYDSIVSKADVFEFYNCYPGNKETIEIFDAHDDDRKPSLFFEAVKWLKRTLRRGSSRQLLIPPLQETSSTVLHNGCC